MQKKTRTVKVDQVSSGLRAVLARPQIYNLFQRLVARTPIWPQILSEFVGPNQSQLNVLDIGCGPASFLRVRGSSFDPARFTGVDPSPRYIEQAQADFPEARFECGTVSIVGETEKRFDLVVISGVLHHVADDDAAQIVDVALSKLTDSGIAISVDPVIFPGQNFFARWMALADRGQHVRSFTRMEQLWKENRWAGQAHVSIRAGHLRMPYNHVVCAVRKRSHPKELG